MKGRKRHGGRRANRGTPENAIGAHWRKTLARWDREIDAKDAAAARAEAAHRSTDPGPLEQGDLEAAELASLLLGCYLAREDGRPAPAEENEGLVRRAAEASAPRRDGKVGWG